MYYSLVIAMAAFPATTQLADPATTASSALGRDRQLQTGASASKPHVAVVSDALTVENHFHGRVFLVYENRAAVYCVQPTTSFTTRYLL
jgi:hypothetical protein